ncbi:hypothetical protein ACQ0MK_09315 [Thalassospira lucentensis]|uniref:hypothetical protein n=1 Tax=Thalassospira lucentensis TaxID=168935 RepID=UPI003D2F0F92
MTEDFNDSDLHMIFDRVLSLYDPEILQNPNWGSAVNFLDIKPQLDAFMFAAQSMMSLDISLIPNNTKNAIYNYSLSISKLLERITKFTLSAEFQSNANSIISEFNSNYQRTAPILATWIPFLIAKKDMEGTIFLHIDKQQDRIKQKSQELEEHLSKNIDKVKETSDEFTSLIMTANNQIQNINHNSDKIILQTETKCEELIDKLIEDLNKKSESADLILSNVKSNSALQAIKPYSKSFHNSSKSNKNSSNSWLLCTIIHIFVAISWGIYCLNNLPPETQNIYQIYYLFIYRIFITAIILTGMLWCARQYKIEKHQHTIALHKANALDSFEAFVEASNDIKTRDAVLLRAAQTIFNSEQTGYLGKDSDFPILSHIEALKSMTK